MGTNLTEKFIDELYELSKSDIPPHIVNQVKRCIIDYIGVTIAGTSIEPAKTNNLINITSMNTGEISIIGISKSSDIYTAILVNGLNAHKADFDDGVNSGIIHLGSPIITSILPVAQKEKLDGLSVIRGIMVGYETALTLAESIQPYHKEKGYHASATCGSIGAAIGIAVALNYTKDQMKNTFSAAATSAYGTLKVLENGSELKPFNIAKAALNGYIAANMGRAGFVGPNDVLEGDTGYLSMMTNKYDLSKLKVSVNERYAVEKVYFKPHAACRYCHPSIDAALDIRKDQNLLINEIEKVAIKTYKWAVKNHDHSKVEGITSAKMSIPYSVAAALVSGKADIHEFTNERISNKEIINLARKVTVEEDEELSNLFPIKSGSILELRTKHGSYEKRIEIPKGEPDNPLTDQELEGKFKSLTSFSNISIEDSDKLIQSIWNIDQNITDLLNLL